MSDPRDDEPIGIEADAPEADWIEQHQPVVEVPDDVDAYPSEVREDDAAISIDSDTPEADWIEQHQPVVEAPDEGRLRSHDLPEEAVDVGELEQDWITTDEDIGAEDHQETPTSPAPAGARGCNALATIAHAVLRAGWRHRPTPR
ncbi:MAG: hypothetical protein ACXV6M_04475 [Ilumatobacteraceae bacterium]